MLSLHVLLIWFSFSVMQLLFLDLPCLYVLYFVLGRFFMPINWISPCLFPLVCFSLRCSSGFGFYQLSFWHCLCSAGVFFFPTFYSFNRCSFLFVYLPGCFGSFYLICCLLSGIFGFVGAVWLLCWEATFPGTFVLHFPLKLTLDLMINIILLLGLELSVVFRVLTYAFVCGLLAALGVMDWWTNFYRVLLL